MVMSMLLMMVMSTLMFMGILGDDVHSDDDGVCVWWCWMTMIIDTDWSMWIRPECACSI